MAPSSSRSACASPTCPIDAIEPEINRLEELKRVKANSVAQITDYLRRNMDAANIKPIKRPLFTITLSSGKERVIVDNEEAVPDELTSVSTKIAPDKNAIAAKLKEIREHNVAVKKRMDAGEDCEHELIPEPAWAHLERGESSIRIKGCCHDRQPNHRRRPAPGSAGGSESCLLRIWRTRNQARHLLRYTGSAA